GRRIEGADLALLAGARAADEADRLPGEVERIAFHVRRNERRVAAGGRLPGAQDHPFRADVGAARVAADISGLRSAVLEVDALGAAHGRRRIAARDGGRAGVVGEDAAAEDTDVALARAAEDHLRQFIQLEDAAIGVEDAGLRTPTGPHATARRKRRADVSV